MSGWTIRRRILTSFAAVLALMMVMGVVAYVCLIRVAHDATVIQKEAVPGIAYSSRLTSAWGEDFVLTQRRLAATDEVEARGVAAQLLSNRAKLESVTKGYESTIFTAQDRENYEAFKLAFTASSYLRIQEDVLNAPVSVSEEARAALRSKLQLEFDKIAKALQAVGDYNVADADDAVRQIMGAVTMANTVIIVSMVAALLLALGLGYLLLQSITRPLTGLLTTTETTATEIAATTSEIGATSKEISATSRELVKTMSEVSHVAEETATLAGHGQEGLERMTQTMHQVMEAVGSINGKLAVLSDKAGNINQVVTTITKVADQTNLLSLNAAIEAEKAGEYGRGFGVVATEIRRLADQTAVATYDIEQMVKEIQSAVSAGVMGMDKFSEEVRRGIEEVGQVGTQLSQIIGQVQALAPRFEAVSEGMQAQTTGAEQISQALVQLSEATQQTVDSLRHSRQAIDGLQQAAGGARSGGSRLRLAGT